MADLKAALTETLRAHRETNIEPLRNGDYRISCDGCSWRSDEYSAVAACDAHDAHLADVLLGLPGVAITPLPEPFDDHGDGIAFWTDQEVGVADGMVVTRLDPGSEAIYFDPSVARKLAAALLAAAVVSEGETHPEAAK